MMEKINRAQLNENLLPTYDYVVKQLGIEPKIQGKGIGLSWNFDATLEAYLHSNTTDFVGRETWIRGFNEQKPLLGVALETWPANNFYGYSEFTVGNTNNLGNGFGSLMFGSNILMVPPAEIWDLDFNMPYRAFVAAGGDHWSFQLGRDRLNWGAGTSGNLAMSDTLKYHNLARITTFSDRFKYTFVTSFFPHQMHYISDSKTNGAILGTGQDKRQTGLHLFMSHRLEGRLFKDKVGLALTESIMYQSEENYFDLRFLNPAAIFHNYYIRSNANSILGLELDYTPIKGLNIYVQAAVDEFTMPGEPKATATKAAYPEAFGVLAGVKGVLPFKQMVGHASLEFARTDPYLYLRYSEENNPTAGESDDFDEYGLNYVGVVREFTNTSGTYYNPGFLGYTYGNDAIVVNLNGGVKSFGKWAANANLFYMAHGTFDMFTVWRRVGGGNPLDVTTPTSNGSDALGNYHDKTGYKSRDAVSHTIVAGVKGSYQILDCLKAFGQLDYINVINYKNKAGAKTHDVQLSIGVTYSI